MLAQIYSRIIKNSTYSIFLVGAIFILTSCSSPEISTPVPTPFCPEVSVQTIESFEVLWQKSAHADEKAEAFRHWDAEENNEIPLECAGCHSRPGFIDLLGVDGSQVGVVDKPVKTGTTITCFVCHNEATYTLDNMTFDSGTRIGGLGPEALCITCHKGRASTRSVNIAIRRSGITNDDLPSEELNFINSHATSAATPFGSEVGGAYEYAGEIYKGRYMRGDDFFSCIRCHDRHSLEINPVTCQECHTFDGIDPKNIRVNSTDFDGNGNITEGIAYEIENLHSALYIAIQDYSVTIAGTPIVFDPDVYPYFFIDLNNNRKVDVDEAVFSNRYNQFTPRLLRAAYNYNYVSHDGGGYSHNSIYLIQILYDSLTDLGGDTTGMTRP